MTAADPRNRSIAPWATEIRTRFDAAELADFFGRFNDIEIPDEWFTNSNTESPDPGA